MGADNLTVQSYERNKTNLQFLTFNMHGRLKVKTSAEQQEQKRKERAKKLAIYRTVTDKIFTKRKNGELDDEILDLTGKVLAENPDIYTFWNVRKETLLKIKNERPDEIESYVSKELGLTEHCIKVNSKSYNSWFQRSWVLDLSQEIDFIKELALCNRCLDLDDRNFHCWDYRRIVVSKSRTTAEDELKFSTLRISNNFSNYSSWHYRSELLPRIYPSSNKETQIDIEKLSDECNLVQNAIFTDPNDQSPWFYQRWLLFSGNENESLEGKTNLLSIVKNELELCQQLHELEPKNKWVIFQMCELLWRINNVDNESRILQLIDALCEIDPLRKAFYKDWSYKISLSNKEKRK